MKSLIHIAINDGMAGLKVAEKSPVGSPTYP
jgi:hypothetical protein